MTPRRAVPRALVGSLLVVLLGGLLAACGGQRAGRSTGDQGYVSGGGVITSVAVADRERPGPVAGTTLDGDRVSLEDYRGHVVVVNVWGSWCGECAAEADMLTQAAHDLSGRGVRFLGIDSRDASRANAQAFVRRYRTPYPSIYDQGGRTLLAFRGTLTPNSVPSTIIVDPQGRVAGSVLGTITRTTLDDLVDDALAGAGA